MAARRVASASATVVRAASAGSRARTIAPAHLASNVSSRRTFAMGMLKDPSKKYKPFAGVDLQDRQWPSKRITKAPRWASVDLRDGNQALINPMSIEQKTEFWNLLLKCGFKEIEAGFPSASDIDFNFIRQIIEQKQVPDDVAFQVLSPARGELIKRTFESLTGADKVIFHLYNAAAPIFRDIVFQNSKEKTIDLAVKHVKLVRQLYDDMKAKGEKIEMQLEYSPEAFSQTEPEFSVAICEAVKEAWYGNLDKKAELPIIFNLPATVEVATPNNYADQVEYFHRNISDRDSVIISLHTHNDRGTGIAASELGLMAGADRVEGCLFGNGERTGNCDLITMALNMYTQGVSPNLDFSDLDNISDTVARLNDIPLHPRHPWAGQLVYTAFSGSHQDAIRKAILLRREQPSDVWAMPYLPVDPDDINRTYEAVIRVNSQSGRAGSATLVSRTLGLDLPKRMQGPFYAVIQVVTEETNAEITAPTVEKAFRTTYYLGDGYEGHFGLVDYSMSEARKGDETRKLKAVLRVGDKDVDVEGTGNGPLSCTLDALRQFGVELDVREYSEHAIGHGSNTRAASYVELVTKEGRAFWGVGVDVDVTASGIKAVISAACNAVERPDVRRAKVMDNVRNKTV